MTATIPASRDLSLRYIAPRRATILDIDVSLPTLNHNCADGTGEDDDAAVDVTVTIDATRPSVARGGRAVPVRVQAEVSMVREGGELRFDSADWSWGGAEDEFCSALRMSLDELEAEIIDAI